jgi:DNA polymerase-1
MYPNLDHVRTLSIDIETYDPDLKELGPGPRRGAYVTCLAIATDDAAWSWNLTHDGPKVENVPAFWAWLGEALAGKEVVTANGMYDFDFLQYKLDPKKIGIIRDVQNAEFLINEHRPTYTLDSLAERYLNLHKEKAETEAYAERMNWKGDHRAHLYKMPFSVVRPYVEADTRLTLQVYRKQEPIIVEQDLGRVHYVESRLIQMLLHMRKCGTPIDYAGLQVAQEQCRKISSDARVELDRIVADCGMDPATFSVNSAANLASLFDALSLGYGMTAPSKTTKNVSGFKPRPSFTKDFLHEIEHPVAGLILDIKANDKADGTFLHQLEKFRVGDRVHPLFHAARTGGFGTVYGRLSCTMPALQVMPGDKQPKMKKLVRGLFVPEPGCLIAAPDYSQADYRFFAHYAQGAGAKQIQDYFQNPDADMHQFTADMAGIERKNAKAPNFGIMFGMGAGGLARNTGKSLEEAQALLSLIKINVPSLRDTPRAMTDIFQRRGYVKTILGRRSRLKDPEKAYRAIAMIIGGSTADLMKKSMTDTYEAGIYDVLIPSISLHDEMVASVPDTKQGAEALAEMGEIMRHVFDLRVPLKVSQELSAKSWADVNEPEQAEFFKRHGLA